MSSAAVDRWSEVPLFRLLVLLDNTGMQPFHPLSEWSEPTERSTGHFLQPERLWYRQHSLVAATNTQRDSAPTTSRPSAVMPEQKEANTTGRTLSPLRTPLSHILHAGVEAWKSVLGSSLETSARAPTSSSAEGSTAQCHALCTCLFGSSLSFPASPTSAAAQDEQVKISPVQDPESWSYRMTHPTSLRSLEAVLESFLSPPLVRDLTRLVCGEDEKVATAEDKSMEMVLQQLVEQFLVDGLARWLQQTTLTASTTNRCDIGSRKATNSNLKTKGKKDVEEEDRILGISQDNDQLKREQDDDATSQQPPLQRMSLACGGVLHPSVVLQLLSRSPPSVAPKKKSATQQKKDAPRKSDEANLQTGCQVLIEFLLDILFPLPLTVEEWKEMHDAKMEATPKRKSAAPSQRAKSKKNAQKTEEASHDSNEAKQDDVQPTPSFNSEPAFPPLQDWLIEAYKAHHFATTENSNSATEENDNEEAKEEKAAPPEGPGTAPKSGRRGGRKTARTTAATTSFTPSTTEKSTKKTEAKDVEVVEAPAGRKRSREGKSEASTNPAARGVEEAPKDGVELIAIRDAAEDWVPPDDGDVYLSSPQHVMRLLQENPESLPRSVLIELRKPVWDAGLTQWELEHHYTAKELKDLVKHFVVQHETNDEDGSPLKIKIKKSATAERIQKSPGATSAAALTTTPPIEQSVSPSQWAAARRATRKSEFIPFLMGLFPRNVDTTTE